VLNGRALRERLDAVGGGADPSLGGMLIPAAVLVAMVDGAEPGVLLTKRNELLSNHAGQVSFPGGRIDPDDASPEAAALREAEEEVGLASGDVEVLGRLAPHVTTTGFGIVPIVGLVPGRILAELRPQPAEVDEMFVLPLSVVTDPAAPRREWMERRGERREFWVLPHARHFIWGATAAILVQLAERLRR
jgi:8-oxo-dGTP pyrophosphatase MutT (NUDIX family)